MIRLDGMRPASVLLTAGFVLACQPGAEALADTGDEAWLAARLEKAALREMPRGFRASWREELVRVYSPRELAEARERVRSRPEHPDRIKIRAQEELDKSGPVVIVYEVMYQDAERWRYNTTNESSNSFADMARDGAGAWQLSDGAAQLLDATGAPEGYEPTQRSAKFERALQNFLQGPLVHSGRSTYEVRSIDNASADEWAATLRRSDGYLSHLNGQIVGDTVVFTDRGIRRPDGTLAAITTYSGYREDNVLGHGVYTEITFAGPDGVPTRVTTLLDVQPLDNARMKDAMRTPELGASDAVRGEISGTLVDMRSGARVIEESQEDGSVTRVDMTDAYGEDSDQRAPWRMLGWGAAGLLVVVLVLKWRQNQAA